MLSFRRISITAEAVQSKQCSSKNLHMSRHLLLYNWGIRPGEFVAKGVHEMISQDIKDVTIVLDREDRSSYKSRGSLFANLTESTKRGRTEPKTTGFESIGNKPEAAHEFVLLASTRS